MEERNVGARWLAALLICLAATCANAQSFRAQCATSTMQPAAGNNNSEPNYNGPTQFTPGSQGNVVPNNTTVNGALKCQQISGGDGLVTRADGPQTCMFSFVPLSGLAEISVGHAGTELPSVFNTVYLGTPLRGDPATTDGAASGASPGTLGPFPYTGAVGLNPDIDAPASGICGGSGQPSSLDGHVDPRQIINIPVMNGNIPAPLLAFDEGMKSSSSPIGWHSRTKVGWSRAEAA